MSQRASLLGCLWLLACISAVACDWPYVSPCDRLSDPALVMVFVGRVTAPYRPVRLSGPVKFHVEEAIRGVDKDADVLISPGRGDCTIFYGLGQRHLIWAYRHVPGALPVASKSSGSLPLPAAAAELRWLRKVVAGDRHSRILGMVQEVNSATLNPPPTPLSGVKVVLTGNGRSRAAQSDAQGVYEFVGVTPGDYQLSASFPRRRMDSRHVQVGKSGCAFVDFGMWPDARIGGLVRSADGTPASGVEMELVSIWPNGNRLPFRRLPAAADGRFLFQGVPPGRYLVGVNISLVPTPEQPFPATFAPVSLAANQELTGLALQLPPPLKTRPITIQVRLPDGRIAAGTQMIVSDERGYTLNLGLTSDERGEARFTGVQGVSYKVLTKARLAGSESAWSRSSRIPAGDEPLRFTLTLSGPPKQ